MSLAVSIQIGEVTALLKILLNVSVNQECSNVKYQSGSKIVTKEFLKM